MTAAPAGRPGTPAPERRTARHREFRDVVRRAAQPTFDRAMALLHSFEFGPAIEGFDATLKADPSCAIADWGIALARWGNPFAAAIRPPRSCSRGSRRSRSARRPAPKTERERAYIDAAAQLYTDYETIDQRARVVAYERRWRRWPRRIRPIARRRSSTRLSLTASALPTDKTYANQLKAGAILETLFAEQPDHPGLAHYIIHSYDVPALADARSTRRAATRRSRRRRRTRCTCRRTRSRASAPGRNRSRRTSRRRDAAQARRAPRRRAARDGLQAYAYLQTGAGQGAAARCSKRLPAIAASFDPTAVAGAAPGSAGVFALAAIPARYALERRDWTEAAAPRADAEPVPVHRSDDALRARARRGAHRQLGRRATLGRRAAGIQRPARARPGEGYWAEQVGDPAAIASALLALAEGQDGRRALGADARGRGARGRHREDRGDAGSARARARAARRDAARARRSRRRR